MTYKSYGCRNQAYSCPVGSANSASSANPLTPLTYSPSKRHGRSAVGYPVPWSLFPAFSTTTIPSAASTLINAKRNTLA